MARVTIYSPPDVDGFRDRVGWYDTATAEHWERPDTDAAARVWLTPAGRWVHTANGAVPEYLTDDEARANLVEWGYGDDAAQRIDRERTRRGRPEIGPEVRTRIPQSTYDVIESMAARNGVTMPEQLRQILVDGAYQA